MRFQILASLLFFLVFSQTALSVEAQETIFYPTGYEAVQGGFVNAGPAAFYASSYDRAWWERTLRYHGSSAPVNPNGYYCVHPGMVVGEQLLLYSSSGVAVCTVGDYVRVEHQAQWLAKWGIEVSWNLFLDLGLNHNNYVEVYALNLQPSGWHFEETGHDVSGGIWDYWNRFGDFERSLSIFGYPLGDEGDSGVQVFERAVLEHTPEEVVRGQHVGASACPVPSYPEQYFPEASVAEGRYFVETGHTVSDSFLTFWEQFGDDKTSLEVFGYPLSSPMQDEGLLVQCFERAIFEQHDDGVLLRRVVAD